MHSSKFQPNTRTPAVTFPPQSCDAQIHVFGDARKYPVRPSAAYATPEDADIAAALRMHKTLGVERGVIVQATAHGTDHRILVDALRHAGSEYRGVAIIDDTVDDKELEALHAAGVRGARFNFWRALNIVPSHDGFLRTISRIEQFGWFAKIHSVGDEWLELGALLDKVKVPVVVDHLGHPNLSMGLDQPAVRMLRECMERDHWWMMVSNADRLSSRTDGWEDTYALARLYTESFPDRVIWCTDWPHVKYEKPMPNDAELAEYVVAAVSNPATLKKMLVDNPAKLFGFEQPAAVA